MAGVVNFNVELFFTNPDLFPELSARARDLRPAFDVIIKKWAKDNEDKFGKAIGAEASGASIDPSVSWQALKPGTIRQKRRLGFADQIMVRTGELEASLEDPERFFQATTAEEAVFGTPMSEDDELKARFNWNKRQTIFLSVDDQRMISATVQRYFELGPDFERILFARGLESVRAESELATMQVSFDDSVAE